MVKTVQLSVRMLQPLFIASNGSDQGKKTLEHRSVFIPFANTEGVGFRSFFLADLLKMHLCL